MVGKEIERKLEFYYKQKKLIHIGCSSRRFYNGRIFKIDNDKGFLILIDHKLGEVPIMFEEILNIEPYLEEMKDGI